MADMMRPTGPAGPPGLPPGPSGPIPGGPPPGALPGGPPGGGVAAKMASMKSLFNPADVAAMLQSGEITPQTKFGELLAKMGISPEDTVQQVVQKTMGEVKKADPLEKMKAFSQPGPQGPPPGLPPTGPTPGGGMPPAPAGRRPPGGMDELFGM